MPTKIVWDEPRRGTTHDGKNVTANIRLSCTIDDAIAMQRFLARKKGHPDMKPNELLDDFVAIHWAWWIDE